MKLLGSLKSLITEAASIDDIKKSISQKQVCSIYYNGDEPGGKGLYIVIFSTRNNLQEGSGCSPL